MIESNTATRDPEDVTIDPRVEPLADRPVGHDGTRVEVDERRAWAVSGFLVLTVALVLAGVGVWQVVLAAQAGIDRSAMGWYFAVAGVCTVVAILLVVPLVVIAPGETRVVQFFGRYIGTVRRTGLTWVVPLSTRRRVSVRVRNFETNALKVNDADGNPVEIAAIVVWQVADTAKATFAVQSYEHFVAVQSEAALRHVATTHPYDDTTGHGTSLRGSTATVSTELAHEVAQRIVVAGIEIIEVRISHLAYAPEIAQAMLQRQQAGAVVAARSLIVDGAVGMVEMALARLDREGIVALNEDRKAAMVANLLVVLCGDQRATPVVNTGSTYT